MERRRHVASGCLFILAVCIAASGCSMFKVKGKGHVKMQYGDTKYEKNVKFDSLEELPAAMKEMGGALAESTDLLVEKLVEASPPGQVKLGDLDPAMAQFEGNPSFDFLTAAANSESPIEFKYAQIGVPSYDQFFQKSTELYALSYQVKQMVFTMKADSAAIFGEGQVPNMPLRQLVDSAQGHNSANISVMKNRQRLTGLASVTGLIAGAARASVTKVQELVAASQQLVAAAPSSITNPKTIIHLDLILKGLKDSAAVVVESGKMLAEMIPQLAGF